MSISVNFNEAEMALLERAASYNQMTVSEFVYEAAIKAALNFVKKLDERKDKVISEQNCY